MMLPGCLLLHKPGKQVMRDESANCRRHDDEGQRFVHDAGTRDHSVACSVLLLPWKIL